MTINNYKEFKMKYLVEISTEHSEDDVEITIEAMTEEEAKSKACEKFWKDYCRMYDQPEDMWEDAMNGEVHTVRVTRISPYEIRLPNGCHFFGTYKPFTIVVDDEESYNRICTTLNSTYDTISIDSKQPIPKSIPGAIVKYISYSIDDIIDYFDNREEENPLTMEQMHEIIKDLDFSSSSMDSLFEDIQNQINDMLYKIEKNKTINENENINENEECSSEEFLDVIITDKDEIEEHSNTKNESEYKMWIPCLNIFLNIDTHVLEEYAKINAIMEDCVLFKHTRDRSWVVMSEDEISKLFGEKYIVALNLYAGDVANIIKLSTTDENISDLHKFMREVRKDLEESIHLEIKNSNYNKLLKI